MKRKGTPKNLVFHFHGAAILRAIKEEIPRLRKAKKTAANLEILAFVDDLKPTDCYPLSLHAAANLRIFSPFDSHGVPFLIG